jgi:HTH-type transcriptional regulator/antitoxin HipB
MLLLSSLGDISKRSPYDDTMPTELASIRELAATVRGRRRALGLSQGDLARRAHVSRQWVSEFEAGKPTAELGLALRILDALGLQLSVHEPGPAAAPVPPRPTVDLDELLDGYRTR